MRENAKTSLKQAPCCSPAEAARGEGCGPSGPAPTTERAAKTTATSAARGAGKAVAKPAAKGAAKPAAKGASKGVPAKVAAKPTVQARPDAADCSPRKARLRPRSLTPYGALFRAMGDDTRLEMLGLLAAARGELCVCDIEKHFDLKQPTISHHLKVLRDADLVTSERRGTWVYYTLHHDTVDRLDEVRALLNG
jgi:ArsR family transcriptional regulator